MPRHVRAILLAIASIAASTGSGLADWTFTSDVTTPGRAMSIGTGGQTLVVECGPGGLPDARLIGPRPTGGVAETYVIAVDRGPEYLLPAECGPDGCHLSFDDTGEAGAFLTALQGGTTLSVGFYRRGTGGEIPLAGSAAALAALYATGCPPP